MHQNALRILGVALSLVVFAVAGSQQGGLDLVVQQIRTLGARQWLGLMAGSMVPGVVLIAPLTERLARVLPRSTVAADERATGTPA